MLSVAEFSEALLSAQATGEAWADVMFNAEGGYDADGRSNLGFRVEDLEDVDPCMADLWNGCSPAQVAALKATVCAVAEAGFVALAVAEMRAEEWAISRAMAL